MQSSKSSSFDKRVKRSKSFDDGYGGRHNNKKNDFHRTQRAGGSKKKQESQ